MDAADHRKQRFMFIKHLMQICESICRGLEFLGVRVDHEKNQVRGKETDISAADSTVKVYVIPTNEELMIARDTLALVTK